MVSVCILGRHFPERPWCNKGLSRNQRSHMVVAELGARPISEGGPAKKGKDDDGDDEEEEEKEKEEEGRKEGGGDG